MGRAASPGCSVGSSPAGAPSTPAATAWPRDYRAPIAALERAAAQGPRYARAVIEGRDGRYLWGLQARERSAVQRASRSLASHDSLRALRHRGQKTQQKAAESERGAYGTAGSAERTEVRIQSQKQQNGDSQ